MADKIRDAFDNIQAEPQLVESTKLFLSKERGKIRRTSCPAVRTALAAACMFFVLAAGLGGYTWSQIPVSYVGIDVNPSMELALNRFDKVVSAQAYNAQGQEVLKELTLKGKNYVDAIDVIVGSERMAIYLADGAELVFTVAAGSGREAELKSGVENCAGHFENKSQSVSVDMETVTQAHGHGISLGKYYAWQQLVQYDDSVTVDECKDMSMSEIHHLISEHEKEHEKEHEGEDSSAEEGHEEGSHIEQESHVGEREQTEKESHVGEGGHIEQENHVGEEKRTEQENHVREGNHVKRKSHRTDGHQ